MRAYATKRSSLPSPRRYGIDKYFEEQLAKRTATLFGKYSNPFRCPRFFYRCVASCIDYVFLFRLTKLDLARTALWQIHHVYTTQLHARIVFRWDAFPLLCRGQLHQRQRPERPYLIPFNCPKIRCRLPPHYMAARSRYARCRRFRDDKPVDVHYRKAPCIQAVSPGRGFRC